MARTEGIEEMDETLRSVGEQARHAWARFAEEVELDRRMQESPIAVLGVAAAAGFVLGGGLWPVLRPFARAAVRATLSPGNLLAIGAALGAMRAKRRGDEQPVVEGGSEAH